MFFCIKKYCFILFIFIFLRFVEEQEPYDTGSDSENENVPAKKTPKKSWSWFRKTDQNSVI
jgi:hypothetical protein